MNKNVFQKLQLARLLLQEKKLTKSGKNKFAGYEYFELQDFLPTVQTIFADTGLCAVFRCDNSGASLTVYNIENPEQEIVFTAPMAAAELKGCHPVQNLGASISYLRRYLYVNALEIVEHDELDARTNPDEEKEDVKPASKPVPKPAPKPVQQEVKTTTDKPATENDWEIKISSPGTPEELLEMVSKAASVMLTLASSEDDVMAIYKRNKQVFEQIKTHDEPSFKALMDTFAKRKNQFKEAA